jgi:hypothetical protein
MNIVPSMMRSFVKLEDESLCYAYLTIYNTSCIVVDLFAAWEYLGRVSWCWREGTGGAYFHIRNQVSFELLDLSRIEGPTPNEAFSPHAQEGADGDGII